MTEPHGCPNACAVNICKGAVDYRNLSVKSTGLAHVLIAGKELLDHVAKFGEYERLIYAGDGRNDYCPSTKLRRYVRDQVLFPEEETERIC